MPDLEQIKRTQQEAWAAGDLHKILVASVIVGERLCEDLDIGTDDRVLDVACGTGNTSLAAARRGAETVGIDYVPDLLERARLRARAEGLDIQFREGDAENLPFEDESFDAVISTFGAMFPPDQQKTADELVRVCRPGGRIGMANWTPGGFNGQLFRISAEFVPPPAGLRPPTNWALGPPVRALFGDRVRWITLRDYTLRMRAASPDAWIDRSRENLGPVARAFATLSEDEGREYREALKRVIDQHNRATDGSVLIGAEYVNLLAIK